MRRMYSKKQILDMGPEAIKGKDINVGDLSATGDVKVFENIVDKDGHKRFVEGDITCEEIEGLTQSYGKWSLSGSHLLIVVAGAMTNASELGQNTKIATVNLPNWVKSKLKILFASTYVRKSVDMWGDNYSTQSVVISLVNTANNIEIRSNALTLNLDRSFRIEYDILIDNAEQA